VPLVYKTAIRIFSIRGCKHTSEPRPLAFTFQVEFADLVVVEELGKGFIEQV